MIQALKKTIPYYLHTQVQIQLSTVMAYLVRSHSQRLDTKLATFGKQLVTSLRSV